MCIRDSRSTGNELDKRNKNQPDCEYEHGGTESEREENEPDAIQQLFEAEWWKWSGDESDEPGIISGEAGFRAKRKEWEYGSDWSDLWSGED